MAQPWQLWMPLYIDRFRGSLHVQGMPGCARAGYLYLLASAWQTDDCTIPDDDFELQILSGLTPKEWTQFKALILRRFKKLENGRLQNGALLGFWNEARVRWEAGQAGRDAKSEARSRAGKAGAEKRWHSKPIANAWQADSKPMARAIANDGLTETVTETCTEKAQKPSRVKAASDPRHASFRSAVMAYSAFKGVKLPWDGSEASTLDKLLKSSPDLTLAEFQTCLNHRARSPGTPHGERPRLWLPNVLKYQQGPLDQFGKTQEVSIGNHSKTAATVNAAQAAIGIIRERQARADRAASGEAGSAPAGEAGYLGLLGPG